MWLFTTARGLPPWILHTPFIIVLFDNVVIPDTFNDDTHVVALFNVVFPDIFNVDMNVEGLLKLTNVGGFNIVVPETFNELKFVVLVKDDWLDKLFKLLNIVFCVPKTLFKIEFMLNTDKPNDWNMRLYENYPCKNKEQLLKRENEIMKRIGSLNTIDVGETIQKAKKK